MTPPPDATQLRIERQGAVLVLVLDGPGSRNSIGPEVYAQIQAQVIGAGQDPAIRAVVLTGAGGFFCSGGNVAALQASARGTLAEATVRTDALNAMIRAIHDGPVPVIAAVEGGAAGLGLSLALSCDMLVAAEGAKFTAAYVKIGLSPDGGATWFLRAGLPRPLVMEMCTLARPLTAERLEQAGMVNAVCAPGSAMEVALDLARRLAEGPQQAIARIKAQINAAPSNDLATHLLVEADGINAARFSAEAAEGLAAFLEKRKPRFNPEIDS